MRRAFAASPRLLRSVLLPLLLAAGTGIPSDPAQAQPVRADQQDMAVNPALRVEVIEGAGESAAAARSS